MTTRSSTLERLTGFLGLPLHPSEIGRFRTRELAVQAATRDGFSADLVEEGLLWWGLRGTSSWLRWTHLSKTWADLKTH